MIKDLDETIEHILKEAGGLGKPGHPRGVPDVGISFAIPDHEWSQKLSGTAINCYLFDIHERRLLREDGWQIEGRGSREPMRRPPPLFFEMSYLITAWTEHVEDEHFLLWRVLETLMDYPVLPEQFLQGSLKEHEWPIQTTVAQMEGVLKSPGEFWTALENKLKPSLSYVVTLGRRRKAVPTDPADAPPVLSTGIRLNLPEATVAGGFRLGEVFQLPPRARVAGVTVAVEGRNTRATTDDEGFFQFEGLPPGQHTLAAQVDGRPYRRTILIRGLDAGRARRRYSDTVLDQDGRPLPGVEVEVEGRGLRAVTDKDGRFELELPPGRYTLRLWVDGWAERRQVTIRDTSAKLPLTLRYGGVPFADGDARE